MKNNIFDKTKIFSLRKKAQKDFLQNYDFIANAAEESILDRISIVKKDFPTVIVNGNGDFSSSKKIEKIYRFNYGWRGDVSCDDELIPLADESVDLFISNLTLHSTNDLLGALIQIKRALKPDSMFIASLFGQATLHELKDSLMRAELSLTGNATRRVIPFPDKKQLSDLMQRAGFDLPVVDGDKLNVSYKNINSLVKDLRGFGEGNYLSNKTPAPINKRLFKEAEKAYKSSYPDEDSRIIATFELAYLTGWKL